MNSPVLAFCVLAMSALLSCERSTQHTSSSEFQASGTGVKIEWGQGRGIAASADTLRLPENGAQMSLLGHVSLAIGELGDLRIDADEMAVDMSGHRLRLSGHIHACLRFSPAFN